LHTIPELGLECHKTAAFVAERLREFGVDEIHEGIAKTGIVAIINGQGAGPTIGLRADMDGLPMEETADLEYVSTHPGRMHACGHDGHTAMLLGAAKYLAETRKFSGRVALIFQPDEEDNGGGELMVKEGIMDRFDIGQVYAMHNAPDFEVGTFHLNHGAIMAAADEFNVIVTGVGGHAAWPHTTVDPLLAGCAIVQALQSIVSRNVDPMEQLVVSVTQIHAGTTHNVIPGTAKITGTVRTLSKDVQSMAIRRMEEIIAGQAASFGVEAKLDVKYGYPPTINHAEKAGFAAQVAAEIAGEDAVDYNTPPALGAEDFSYMLEARPGAYVNLGQGSGPMCHHPSYNFNDEIGPIGASFFARLVERAQPLAGA
jgi:hippurate hydrolase